LIGHGSGVVLIGVDGWCGRIGRENEGRAGYGDDTAVSESYLRLSMGRRPREWRLKFVCRSRSGGAEGVKMFLRTLAHGPSGNESKRQDLPDSHFVPTSLPHSLLHYDV
jgi:hypothetical protein